MKSYGVTVQMKPLQQYFHMVLFIQYVVLTFESVDKILWCYHSNETSVAQRLQGAIYFLGFYEKDIWNFCEFFDFSPIGMEVVIKELSHCLWNRCIACQVIRKILVLKSSYRKMETFNLNGLIHLDVDIFLLLPSPLRWVYRVLKAIHFELKMNVYCFRREKVQQLFPGAMQAF